ncbi:hypothetical protein EUZ85_16675 [Hahella sp. KA22]|uniref:hypothetical protein n=1 Tax=Hahella sp. KA22 TaxID=1628392 RepID=UPI000FDEF34E|nr:hypothetical protein [Hahella sp. KA22]AZZ92272.1 hypothetical protein ENC22_14110 [Hahella sp. KA22]QAY55643.1 hypothetical protein EUZ85_16675 [Hahella sp. KA22]
MKLLEFIDRVKKRPGMYLYGDNPLNSLEMMIYGYEVALKNHAIEGDLCNFRAEFNNYLFKALGWSTSRGWSNAIVANTASTEEATEIFFDLVGRFVLLKYGIKSSIYDG